MNEPKQRLQWYHYLNRILMVCLLAFGGYATFRGESNTPTKSKITFQQQIEEDRRFVDMIHKWRTPKPQFVVINQQGYYIHFDRHSLQYAEGHSLVPVRLFERDLQAISTPSDCVEFELPVILPDGTGLTRSYYPFEAGKWELHRDSAIRIEKTTLDTTGRHNNKWAFRYFPKN